MRLYFPIAWIAVLLAQSAQGFSIETTVTRGCHEDITHEALRRAGRLPEGEDVEAGLRTELAFHLPAEAGPWALAVLIGVRDNDLRGAEPLDFNTLAAVHEDPFGQASHCLRAPTDDDGEGDLSALGTCRDQIRELLVAAQALDRDDPGVTNEVPVAMAFRSRPLALRASAVRVGRALHALQDSFAHTLRSDDLRWPRSVFNYVEAAGRADYLRHRDGTPHVAWMDACDPNTADDASRAEAAVEASRQLIQATDSGEVAQIDAVLDSWLTRDPLCESDPTACLPPDLARGCSAAPNGSNASLLLLAALGGFGFRHRRLRIPVRGSRAALVTLLALATPVAQAAPDSGGYFGFYGGLSIDRAGGQGGALVGYRFNPRWRLALNVEWSPWIDLGSGHVASGTVNIYPTITWQWLSLDRLALRSALGLGASVLTFPLVGARPGSAGPFVMISLISVALPVGPKSVIELRPDVAVAIPDVRGVPILYRQYRFLVTWERNF